MVILVIIGSVMLLIQLFMVRITTSIVKDRMYDGRKE